MSPKRKQRNKHFSNDSVDSVPTAHSVSEEKIRQENPSTPFLSQLFDSLSEPKSSSGNLISETALSSQNNDELLLDTNNKTNIKSHQGCNQPPFLSQLFNTISNTKALSENYENTDFQTKTNSNDQPDLNMDKDENQITESLEIYSFETESRHDGGKEFEINNTVKLNSNINDFKENVQSSPEDTVESVKNKSETPFFSQLFDVLDKSSPFSGGIDKKSDHLTSEVYIRSQNSVETSDDKDNISKPNSTPPSLSQLFDMSNASNTPVEQLSMGADHSHENNCIKNSNLKSNFQDKGESTEAPFLSQLFNSLSSSSRSNQMKKDPDNFNSNMLSDKRNSKVFSEGKQELAQNTLEQMLISQNSKGNSDDAYNTSVEQIDNNTNVSHEKKSIEAKNSTSNVPQNDESSKTFSEAPFLSQLFNSLSSSSTSNQSKKEIDNINSSESTGKLNSKLLSEGEMKLAQKTSTAPFLTQLFGTLGNSSINSDQVIDNKIKSNSENESSHQGIDSKIHLSSQNHGECSIGDAKLIKDFGTAPFLSQLFDSINNKQTVHDTSVRDVVCSSGKDKEHEKFLSNVKDSKKKEKKEHKCYRFDMDFYVHQLEIADALEGGNLKEINENLTTGLVLAAKATGHLVGRIYEWIKKSYSNKSELKLKDVAKQLLMMNKIISYFDKTSFSKTDFEEWMTQLNNPYVFPSNSKMLWSNVFKNDEFGYKIDPKFYDRMEREYGEKEHFSSYKRKYFDLPCDKQFALKNSDMRSDENDERFINPYLNDKFDLSHEKSKFAWNRSEENFSRFLPPDRPNTERFGPLKDDFEQKTDKFRQSRHLYSSQNDYINQRNKLDLSWNQSETIRNEFDHSRDQFGQSRNQFGPQEDSFDSPSHLQGHSRDEITPPGNQFRPSKDQFGNSRTDFDHSKNHCDPTREQPISNIDQFGPSRDEFCHPKGDFGPSRNKVDVLRDESFSLRSEQSEFGPSTEMCLPSQGRLTPPGAHPSTVSMEYYSHGQQQGPHVHSSLSNIPPQHILPPPPGPPPSIALPNISAPQLHGVLQAQQQRSQYSISSSNIPYNVPLPNLPLNGPGHPPNVMAFTNIGQPPPPIPQSLLQMQPHSQDFTHFTVAPPNTSYSNVSVPEEWIRAQNLLKNKGELPCPPSANIPDLCVLPRSTDAGQNISQTTDTQIMIPISISQNEPFVAPCNQITDSSASQRPQDATTTTVSLSSNIKLQTSPQSTKKHKIDIKLKKKNYHDENEESKKSIYICCLPKGLSNDMMKKLLLVCGEVEEFHREIIDGVEAESCVVKFQEMETVFKSYHVLNEFCILDSMLIVAVLNEKLFNDEDKEIDENGILETKSAIDLLKLDIEMEIRKQNTELSSSKRLSDDDDDDDAASKKFKVDNDNEIYGPDCTDIEISNLDIDIGKTLMVPLLEKCGGVVKWRHKDDKIVFKYKNKQSAAIASQLLRGLRIPDKYIQVNILSKEAENMEAMEVDKGKKNTMKSWLNQAIVANQEEFVNHLQKLCAMYRCNDFDPFAYKTKMCLEAKCTGNCESYHIPEKKDRRRDPRIYNYSDIECKNIRDGKHCPDGDMCSKSHTKNEREFHESRIHTSICQNWENTKKKCEKNKLCISAHPETPEVLFSEVWHDLYVCGLHQTYQYLEGSVHNLRNIKLEPGAMYVLVVSPSNFMVRWLTKAIRKLAGRHRLRVEEITEEKTVVDSATVVIGTPDAIQKMITSSHHRSYELNNITCLILDDVSLLLHKHLKNMKNILSSIIKYSSKDLNKIVVGDAIFQSEVDTLSLLLETKFTVLGDIRSEGGFSFPQDIKDEKKKLKKQRHISTEDESHQDHTTGRSPRFRSPRSISSRSRSPQSKSPSSRSPRPCYRDHSPGSPRTRFRNHSPSSPRFRYRDYSPDSHTTRYKDCSPNSSRSHYREYSPNNPRYHYKRHSPGSPRARRRDISPFSKSPRSRYRDFSPERGPSRSKFPKYPAHPRGRYPLNPSGNRGPSRYPDPFPKGRGRTSPTHCIGPPIEINFPLVDHCYNLRSICDDLGLAGYSLRTIVVRALNFGPNPHRILQSLRDADVFVQINKEVAEFKILEKRADNVISEENFKRAFIQTKMLIDYLRSTVHIGSIEHYGISISRIAIETLNKNIEYITEEIKVHLQNVRITPTPINVFEILAAVLGERSVINTNRPKGSNHYDITDMSCLDDDESDVDNDLEMVNARTAELT